MKTITIQEIMSKPVHIAKSAKLTEALDKMIEQRADPLIVTNNGEVIGTVSRKSIAEKIGSKHSSNLAPAAVHVAACTEDDFTSAYPDQGIEILIPLLQHHKMVVVLDKSHNLVGQVTGGDLLKVLEPRGDIDDVIEDACTIQADERVVHLRRRMVDDNINKFVVTEGGEVIGMVTETDVARAMVAFKEVVEDRHQDHRIRNLLVRDIMSSPVIALERTAPLKSVVDLMLKKNVSAIPITEERKLVGLVTRTSLVLTL
ncbi:MAG: CBS domain-containing protein [Methanomicrobiales archaeon]|nr:CBS domain-containing protein [Methanomicrobiales archaeon]